MYFVAVTEFSFPIRYLKSYFEFKNTDFKREKMEFPFLLAAQSKYKWIMLCSLLSKLYFDTCFPKMTCHSEANLKTVIVHVPVHEYPKKIQGSSLLIFPDS